MSSVISYDFVMDNNKIQLIGAPCGHHGPYTFYKAFKYNKNGKCRILALSDFFFVKLWSDSDLMSIGELQLLWMDKNSEQILASLRLYFLPENTPEGRSDDHGEDEVLAISEKVVLRAADLLERIITEEARWERGLSAVYQPGCPPPQPPLLVARPALDFQDVLREKQALGAPDEEECAVVVLSFPRYCRYRGILKRLEGVASQWLHNTLVVALGGFAVPRRNTRVLFCKDTFDYPDLEGHELLCNHLAPNLKGRPRRKRKKRSLSPGGSESNESESSLSTVSSSAPRGRPPGVRNGLADPHRALAATRRSVRFGSSPEERDFLHKLHSFMRMRDTPISRVPHLGFKEIDLFAFYSKVQKLGGYSAVTTNKMWKPIYDELGGDQGNTSAATYTRRHYERLLLPFEKSIKETHSRQINNRQFVKLKGIKSGEKKEMPAGQSKTIDIKGAMTNGNRSDKITTEVKSSSLRCVRPKIEKAQDSISLATVTVVPESASQGKENIPLTIKLEASNAVDTKSEQLSRGTEPEIIDLVSDHDSPVKIGRSPVPALKKRKLEILKEGGLEVTAISSGVPEATVGSITIVPERRPSVIQHAAPMPPSENQVSITVTPDVSHMIEMASSPIMDTASTPSPSHNYESASSAVGSASGQNSHRFLPELKIPSVQNLYGNMSSPPPPPSSAHSSSSCDSWTPPKVVQSRSIYARSETVVYGDPKDEIEHPKYYLPGRVTIRPPLASEVLDLRKKGAEKPIVTVSRVPNVDSPYSGVTAHSRPSSKLSNGPPQLSVIGGRHIVGSNLEITVVDVPKPSAQPQHKQTNQRSSHSQKKSASQKSSSSKMSSRLENGRQGTPNDTHKRNSSSTFNAAQLIIPNPYLSSATNGRKNVAELSRGRTQQPQNQSQQNHNPQQQQQQPLRQPQKKNSSTAEDSVSYLPPSVQGANVSGFPPHAESVSGSATKSPPYLPLVDPMYYSSVFGGRTPALFSPGFLPRVQSSASTPMFAPTAEQLQLYKELMNHHHGGLTLSQQIAATGNFLGLLRDGSTSITPVSPTHFPTFK